MGGYLFFGAFVVHWPLDLLGFDNAGSIPLEFGLHVGRRVIDAARCGDRSFMAILVMGWKVVFLSVPYETNNLTTHWNLTLSGRER
jgi:hypothetical protein